MFDVLILRIFPSLRLADRITVTFKNYYKWSKGIMNTLNTRTTVLFELFGVFATALLIFAAASHSFGQVVEQDSKAAASQNFGAATTPLDFDGDGKSDITVYRPSDAQWWHSESSDGVPSAVGFGCSPCIPVPADYTGDGQSDHAMYSVIDGVWYILQSEDNQYYSFRFGVIGDIPAVGDFDGDGKSDPAIYRESTGTFYILQSTAGIRIERFGSAGDKPTVADYDGDGKDDLAVYRTTTAEWWINASTDGIAVYQFGIVGGKAASLGQFLFDVLPADYDGDGKADPAYFTNDGTWFVLRSDGSGFYSFPFGGVGDWPINGDFDGDGIADPGVFRPSEGRWYLLQSTNGFRVQQFGIETDFPLSMSSTIYD
jgi:hypothetical protein